MIMVFLGRSLLWSKVMRVVKVPKPMTAKVMVFVDPVASGVKDVIDGDNFLQDLGGEDEDRVLFFLSEVVEAVIGGQARIVNGFVGSPGLVDVGLITRMVKNGDEPVGVGLGCCL
jgi:hypothetical protein